MSMTLSGNGTITGLVSGGLPDGTVLPADLSTGGPYWDTSGNLLVGKTSATANGGDVQVSKGITFPATQVACSDANTLDDYEEGTWTPGITPLTGDFTAGFTLGVAGRYTKIGNRVIIWFKFSVTTVGTAGTGFNVSGLPFTNSGTSTQYPPFNIVNVSNDTFTCGRLNNNATTGLGYITWLNNHTYHCAAVYEAA